MMKNVVLHVMYPILLSDFNETGILSTDFRKILKYQISRKTVRWEPRCSMRTDRQTDTTKLIVAFHNFAKASKKRTLNSVGKIPISCPGHEPTAYDHKGTSTDDTDYITAAEEISSNYVKRCNSVSPTTIIIWFCGG
jgi:hypothetical protein